MQMFVEGNLTSAAKCDPTCDFVLPGTRSSFAMVPGRWVKVCPIEEDEIKE